MGLNGLIGIDGPSEGKMYLSDFSDSNITVGWLNGTIIYNKKTYKNPETLVINSGIYIYSDALNSWFVGGPVYIFLLIPYDFGSSYNNELEFNAGGSLGWLLPDGIYYQVSDYNNVLYTNKRTYNITNNTTYTSYFNSRYTHGDNSNDRDWYDADDKAVIKNNKINLSSNSTTYTLTHHYDYDYRYSTGVLWFTEWDTSNASSYQITTFDRIWQSSYTKTGINFITSDNKESLLGTLNHYYNNTLVIKDNKFTFKWLYWDQNTNAPPSS